MSEFNIEVEGGSSVRLPTAGKYCDRNIVVTATVGEAQVEFASNIPKIDNGTAFVRFNVVCPYEGIGATVHLADKKYPTKSRILNTLGIEEGYFPECVIAYGHYPFTQRANGTLKKIIAPKLTRIEGGYFTIDCLALEFVQFGSIGYPVQICTGNGFSGSTQSTLTIELYVDAETIADIPTTVTNGAPWGATNATVIYRNSTTGEVITE